MYVYIVECSDGLLYVGITSNLKRRIGQHNKGVIRRSFTKGRLPVKLVFWERFLDKHEAAKREKEVKKWRREKKLKLIKKIARSYN